MSRMISEEESDNDSAQDCSECVLQSIMNEEQPAPAAVDELRKEYLTAITGPALLKRWIQKIRKLLGRFINGNRSGYMSTTVITCQSTQLNNHQAYVALRDKKIILIGRSNLFDIDVPVLGNSVSRLHALIVKVTTHDNRDLFAIVDFWSRHGTRVHKRSSKPANRSVIYVSATDPFIMEIGDEKIQFNTKECIVCLNNPRNRVFDACRHFVVCSECAHNLTKCPLCSIPIRRLRSPADEMDSYQSNI